MTTTLLIPDLYPCTPCVCLYDEHISGSKQIDLDCGVSGRTVIEVTFTATHVALKPSPLSPNTVIGKNGSQPSTSEIALISGDRLVVQTGISEPLCWFTFVTLSATTPLREEESGRITHSFSDLIPHRRAAAIATSYQRVAILSDDIASFRKSASSRTPTLESSAEYYDAIVRMAETFSSGTGEVGRRAHRDLGASAVARPVEAEPSAPPQPVDAVVHDEHQSHQSVPVGSTDAAHAQPEHVPNQVQDAVLAAALAQFGVGMAIEDD